MKKLLGILLMSPAILILVVGIGALLYQATATDLFIAFGLTTSWIILFSLFTWGLNMYYTDYFKNKRK